MRKVKQWFASPPDLKRSNWSMFGWGAVFGMLSMLLVSQLQPITEPFPLWLNITIFCFAAGAIAIGLWGRFHPWLPSDVKWRKDVK